MVQLTLRKSSTPPQILLERGEKETTNIIARYNNGERVFSFDRSIYGNSEVKALLIDLQQGRCCFCESYITHIDFGDVEHFRPKGGWVQDKEAMNAPGYYWLAYDWNNLFLCCAKCNQRNKKNYFPVMGAYRALTHHQDIEMEQPVFIHPVNDNPELYIEFIEASAKEIDNSERGSRTIEMLGLNRVELYGQRLKMYKMIEIIYRLAKGHPETSAKEEAKQYLYTIIDGNTEYAAMLRCFFRENPINF